jgi:hypothetical protein
VQPDYGSGITKEDAIEFAKEIQRRFNNYEDMLEALKEAYKYFIRRIYGYNIKSFRNSY